jgi:Fe-S cluster biogenesis protein NfuA
LAQIRPAAPASAADSASAEVVRQVAEVLALIRPAIQEDGGDIELVAVTSSGQVQLRLHGACVDCPSSSLTLQNGIERNLRDRIDAITSVVAVP